MKKQSSFPFIDAGETDHVGLGRAIGEHLRDRLQAHCETVLERMSAKAGLDSLIQIGQSIRDQAARAFPHFIAEFEGMAAAAGIDLHKILLVGCEESAMNAVRERCTTIAFSTDDCVMLGHNEDWSPGYEENLYVVRARMPSGMSFLSLAYLGAPPGSSVAVNSHGIAFSGNSLIGSYRPGIAKNLILRSQVEARSLDEFGSLATQGPRATCNNTMAVDRGGRMIDIEMGLDQHVVIHPTGDFMVHTNHVLAPELAHLDQVERPCSSARLTTASEIVSSGVLSRALMEEILHGHAGWPHSVCLHAETDHYDEAQTVASAIVDLDDLSLSVANGPPCDYDYVTYQLH